MPNDRSDRHAHGAVPAKKMKKHAALPALRLPERRAPSRETDMRKEPRHPLHVVAIRVAERGERLTFLDPGEPPIHEHQDWEHRQGEDRRPLQQKPEHDEDEAVVLRMPNTRVDAGVSQSFLALCAVERLPAIRDQPKAGTDESVAQKVK